MAISNVSRPMMYGFLGGAALALLSMIAGWTSSGVWHCTFQVAMIIGFGIVVGLIVRFGPIQATRWLFGYHRPDATARDVARRVALLCGIAGEGGALFAASQLPRFRLEMLLLAWLAALLTAVAAQPRIATTPGGRWGFGVCLAVAVVYGPFAVAAISTWWLDGSSTWWRGEMLPYGLLVPGGFVVELTSAAIWHRHPDLSPIELYTLEATLSAIVVFATAWLAARSQWWRWIAVLLVGCLCSWAALCLDAVMRA